MITISGSGDYVPPKFMTSKPAAQVLPQPLFTLPQAHRLSEQKHTATNLYFEEVWPVLFVLKVLGIFPYCVTSSGEFILLN
jgi:hypothetical protein